MLRLIVFSETHILPPRLAEMISFILVVSFYYICVF